METKYQSLEKESLEVGKGYSLIKFSKLALTTGLLTASAIGLEGCMVVEHYLRMH